MYDFQPKLPVDHVISLVRLIRSGDANASEILKLAGAITGELGALLANGPIFSVQSSELTFEEALEKLESLEFSTSSADPSFDITPWIPIILFVIETLLKRFRG